MRSPLFGLCKLIPHGMDEEPTGVLVYVEHEDRPGHFVAALIRDGQFCGRNLKPVTKPVVRWYSVQREDGSVLF
jgi:hypothetical protein